MTDRQFWATFALLVSGLVGVILFVPSGYIWASGFPLDDAWIHAVYGRSIANNGMLAYNPGELAAGETAPLWALVFAIPHLVTTHPPAIIASIKCIGFGLHVLAVAIFALSIRAVVECSEQSNVPLYIGVFLVLVHPDLVAASISGMEIPLAECTVALIVWATISKRYALLGMATCLTTLARPETAILAFVVPALYWRNDRIEVFRHLMSSAIGSFVVWLGWGAFHLFVTGRPLPNTFYAKVTTTVGAVPDTVGMGYFGLFSELSVLALPLIPAIGLAGAVYLLIFRRKSDARRFASTLYVSGAVFSAVSFVLVPPVDPAAYYHQRFVLPGVPLMILPVVSVFVYLFAEWGRSFVSTTVMVALTVCFAGLILLDLPQRLERLHNDARNIDDVQVSIGKRLSTVDRDFVTWVIDAGAIRYFSEGEVVDLIGLNSGELLGDSVDEFLMKHRPDAFVLLPGWVNLEHQSADDFQFEIYEVSSPYTVTSFKAMRRQFLFWCEPPGRNGVLDVRGRMLHFRCAENDS